MSDVDEDSNLTGDQVENILKKVLRTGVARPKRAPLEVFSGHPSQDVTLWVEEFKDRARASGWDEEITLANIPDYLTGTAKNWYNLCVRDIEPSNVATVDSSKKVLDLLKTNFLPEENEEFLRSEIEKMRQKDEPVGNYLINKRALCKRFNPNMENKELVRLLLIGMNTDIASKCFEKRPQDFESLLSEAKKIETNLNLFKTAGKQNDNISGKIDELVAGIQKLNLSVSSRPPVNRNEYYRQRPIYGRRNFDGRANDDNIRNDVDVNHGNNGARQMVSDGRSRNPDNNTYDEKRYTNNGNNNGSMAQRSNWNRNENRYMDRNDTRNRNGGPKCFGCGRIGHIQINCRFTQPRNNQQQQNTSAQNNSKQVNMAIKEVPHTDESSLIYLPITINGRNVQAAIDTGADISLIGSESEVIKGMDIKSYDGAPIFSAEKKSLKVIGMVPVIIEFNHDGKISKVQLDAIVVDNLQFVILGNDFNSKTGIWIHPQTKSIKFDTDLLNNYRYKNATHDDTQEISEVDSNEKQSNNNNLNTMKTITHGNKENFDDSYGENFQSYYSCLTSQKEDTDSKLIADCIERTKLVPFASGEIRIGLDLDDYQEKKLLELLYDFRDVFSFDGDPIGNCDFYEHEIDTNGAKPFHVQPYPTSDKNLKIIREHLDNLLRDGIIRPSKSPWASSPHIVGKKDGSTRMVVDYRRLNSLTKRDSYPLPSIELCLSLLRNAKYFSTIDLLQGFHQINMSSASIEKTAFTTHFGMFEYVRLPFGLMNAPAAFQRVMDITLDGLKFNSVLVFMDDILVFSPDFESHIERLHQVFERLQIAGLTIKPTKTSLLLPGVSFLGYFVDSQGIKMQPSKIAAIKNYPRPQNVTDVRSFVGLCSFYRKLYPNFATDAAPLTKLTRKATTFNWTIEQEEAFENIKRKLLEFPILIHYDPTLPIELHCDASGIGLGATIGHIINEKFHAVQHASRLLSDCETRYSTTDKESLCIVWAIEKFKRFVMGLPFTVYTDHRALNWLNSKEKLPSRLQRFALELQGYDMKIAYKAGKTNLDADALSRHPVLPPEETEDQMIIYSLAAFKDQSETNHLKSEQETDEYFGPILRALKYSDPIRRSGIVNYVLIDDMLYRMKKRKTGDKLTICVPRSMREDVLYLLHDDIFGCHMGVVKTLDKLRERFYFPHMEKFVRDYVKSCKSCMTRKKPREKPTGYLKPIEVGSPFDMVGIDLWGPIKESASGNSVVIACTDYLTRYVEIQAVPNGSKWEVARFLVDNVIKNHGCPSKLLSDRGLVFISGVVEELYEILGIEKLSTTKYRPQTDGLTEAFNKSLGDMVSHYVSADQTDWDRYLSLIQFAYNTTKNTSTGYTPFFLVHGREARLPADVDFNIPRIDTSGELATYPGVIKEKLALARELAQQNIAKSQLKSSEYYNKKRKGSDFKVNDEVLYFTPRKYKGKTNKLLHRFSGPFKVAEVFPNNTVRLKSISGRAFNEVANVEFLKHFHDRILYTEDTEDDSLPDFEISGAHKSSSSDSEEDMEVNDPAQDITRSNKSEVDVQSSDTSISYETAAATPETSAQHVRYNLRSYHKSNSGAQIPAEEDGEGTSPRSNDAVHGTEDDSTSLQTIMSSTSESSSSDETVIPDPQNRIVRRKKKVIPEGPIRRSERLQKKQPKFALLASSLLVTITLASSSFTRVNPVIWRETDRPVIAGVTQFLTNVFYDSPCIIFNTSLTDKFEPYTESLRLWCDDEFEQSWIKPIESFCSNPFTSGLQEVMSRMKRFIGTTAIVSTVVISIFAQVGFFIYSLNDKVNTKSEVTAVAVSQEKIIENMDKFKSNELKVASILSKLEKSQDDTIKEVNNISSRLNIIMLNNVPILTNVAKLTAKLTVMKDRLMDIGREWTEGIFSPKILEIFALNLNCSDKCPLKLFKPQKCYIDRNKRKISFSFQTRTVKSSATVLKADSFRLIQKKDNSSLLCRKIFSGPRAVVYDRQLDCVTPLQSDTATNDDLILSPAVEYCSESSPLNNTQNLWKNDDCKEKHQLSERDFIQIKNSNDYNYVYCPTLKIVVFNRTFECPPHVFSLPHFTSFRIGKLSYNSEQLNMKSSLNVNPVSSSRVNFHLLPILPDLDFEEEISTKKIVEKLDSINPITPVNESSNDWIYITIIIFLIISIITFTSKSFFSKHSDIDTQSSHEHEEEAGSETETLTTHRSDTNDVNEESVPKMKEKHRRRKSLSPSVTFMAILTLIVMVDGCPESIHLNITRQKPCPVENHDEWCNDTFSDSGNTTLDCINHLPFSLAFDAGIRQITNTSLLQNRLSLLFTVEKPMIDGVECQMNQYEVIHCSIPENAELLKITFGLKRDKHYKKETIIFILIITLMSLFIYIIYTHIFLAYFSLTSV